MESVLHLVRHGEAAAIEDLDPGLTDAGRAQAHAVGVRLSGIRFDHVVHSSRRRARETAEIAAVSLGGVVPHVSEHAEDRTPIPGDRSDLSAVFRAFLDGVPDDERDPDGENLDRSIAELSRAGSADRQLLVVTHNFVIGWFVRDAVAAPRDAWTRLNSANGALTIIRYRTGEPPRLIAFNDRGHLGDL